VINWRAGAGAIALVVALTATTTACELEHRDSPAGLLDEDPVAAETTPVSVAQLSPTLEPNATVDLDTVWSVREILDGDTFVVSGPGGLLDVRLIGIAAPDAGACYSAEAVNGLQFFAAGVPLRLLADHSNADADGRLLRYVETAEGIDIGAEMVRGGFAVSAPVAPDTARSALYDQLQAEATAAGRGMWGPGICGH